MEDREELQTNDGMGRDGENAQNNNLDDTWFEIDCSYLRTDVTFIREEPHKYNGSYSTSKNYLKPTYLYSQF